MPLALQSNDPPSIFQQWGGGQEATQIKSGKLRNLTSLAAKLISQLERLPSAAAGLHHP
ncbi:MAG TPA: hypothetical protein VF979_11960 [Streptosporangiaceae bacterium]